MLQTCTVDENDITIYFCASLISNCKSVKSLMLKLAEEFIKNIPHYGIMLIHP